MFLSLWSWSGLRKKYKEPRLLEKKNQELEPLERKSGAGDTKKLADSSALFPKLCIE